MHFIINLFHFIFYPLQFNRSCFNGMLSKNCVHSMHEIYPTAHHTYSQNSYGTADVCPQYIVQRHNLNKRCMEQKCTTFMWGCLKLWNVVAERKFSVFRICPLKPMQLLSRNNVMVKFPICFLDFYRCDHYWPKWVPKSPFHKFRHILNW